MTTTSSLRVRSSRYPHAIPTCSSAWDMSRAVIVFIVTAAGTALLGAVLIGHSLAEASMPVAQAPSASATAEAPAPSVAPDAIALRAAVQAIAAFPDPYPASAAVAP